MSIPVIVYKVMAGRVWEAQRQAVEIVESWALSPGHESVGAELMRGGWPLVELVEKIAIALLAAQGCDTQSLEEMPSLVSESAERDALAQWERVQPRNVEPTPLEWVTTAIAGLNG